jgi:hypothetical protein
MRLRSLSVSAPLLVVLTGAFVVPIDSLGFHVEAKSKLTKTFETKVQIASQSMSITVDGNDALGGADGPKIEITDNEKIVVTDEYVSAADGRATKLVRHFDDLGGDGVQTVSMPEGSGLEDKEEKVDKESPLAGKTVVFTWKDDAYAAEWAADDKGDDDLLEKLEADMDLAGLLPAKSVSDGDTWELAPKLFNKITSPGGRLQLRDKNEKPDEEMPIQEEIEKNIDGEGKATYKGTREVDGVKVGVIAITAELTSSGTAEVKEREMRIEYQVSYTGEALWDLKGGHLHSLELQGKLEMSMDTKSSTEFDGKSHELHERVEFAGGIEHRVAVE